MWQTSVATIRPGDRVIVAVQDDLAEDEVLALKAKLEDRFPEVEWSLARGVGPVVAVMPASAGDE